jgi:hypothetical protein
MHSGRAGLVTNTVLFVSILCLLALASAFTRSGIRDLSHLQDQSVVYRSTAACTSPWEKNQSTRPLPDIIMLILIQLVRCIQRPGGIRM